MKESAKFISGGIILLVGFLILSYIIPFNVPNMACYEEIANKSCIEGSELEGVYLNSNWRLEPYDFICCDIDVNMSMSRLNSYNKDYCKLYTFLEEDDQLCMKRYKNFWKVILKNGS